MRTVATSSPFVALRRPPLGQSMVEFIIVFPVLILLLLGALQFGLIYHAKTTLNYATFEATRAGALNHGDPERIGDAFARGLSPLYTHDDTVRAVQTARDKVMAEVKAAEFVCIERISPNSSHFRDLAITGPDGDDEIPNDNLMYRDPAPAGTPSLSIQDANLLKLRITYCYPMYVPFVNETIRAVSLGLRNSFNPDGLDSGYQPQVVVGSAAKKSFLYNCYDKRRIPIQAQAILRMQTPIREYPFPESCH